MCADATRSTRAPNRYKLVNADQHIELATEALLNSYQENGGNSTFGFYNNNYGLGMSYDRQGAEDFYDIFTGGWLSNYRATGRQTDWMDAVTRTGLMQEYGLSLSGGGASERAAKYYLSMNYMDEEAFVIGKDLTRYAFRFNLDHAPSKWVKYGFNSSLSYGTTGNQEVGGSWYASRNLFGFGYNYNNLPGMAHEQFGNPDLRWEQTNKFNVGVDISLFNRINIELDYYNHKTKDMVFAVPVSMTTGLASYYRNIGKLSNKGFEASLNAHLVKTRDWLWDVTLTGSFNKNEVVKLSTDDPIESTIQITEAGRPIYQFKMKEYAGVDPDTGVALWYLNETGDETTTNYNAAAKRYLGDPNPDFAGSISTSVSWKGLDVAVQFNYSMGAKVYGNNLHYDEQIGGTFNENYTQYIYDNRWQKPGDITDVPRLTTDPTYENQASSRFLMDGDYFKIRSLNVGYTLPQALLEKTFIRSCRVFANIENLYTFTADNYRGFDPATVEVNGVQFWNYPQPRTVMFGVTLGF